ncbi:MAG: reverse transcriptase domain-containing protein [Nitrospirales bacterium]
MCIDIDIPKAELKDIDFADRTAKHERLYPLLQPLLKVLQSDFAIPSTGILLEETGGRGYHVWLLLNAALAGETAVAFGRALKSRIDFDFEFFPKQGSLGPNRKYGNLIKLPLGVHQKYGQRSIFFSLVDGTVHYYESLDDSLQLLEQVTPIPPDLLERAVEGNHADLNLDIGRTRTDHPAESSRPQFVGPLTDLLTNCTALRQIRDKAHAGRALSHTEAFQFANAVLSHQDGEKCVHQCMRVAFGDNYDERRTCEEVERIRPLFTTSCRTLVEQRVCPGYCKKSVQERNQDPLVANTSPCSVWLRRARTTVADCKGDPSEVVANSGIVERAFFRLKQYHEHEDSLFYDPFDFESFEAQLASRSQVIAHAFRQRMDMPLVGYLPVNIPKKLDDNLAMKYRRMSYSTVYDQVPIQAVFDVIAPGIETSLLPCSCGYRWNQDTQDPLRIFEDWRVAYPRFRSDIMSAIQRNPMGYHICCDIKEYYDHVDHNILFEQIRMVVSDDYILSFIKRIIRLHEADPGDKRGLPQGPAYARLLANLYLNDFDRNVQDVATAYFRYVDDFFLIFDSYESAERGLDSVVLALRKLGLELSDDEKKRAVIEPNTELAKIRRTLDKIQYGILEGTRQIQHLDPQTVSDFYSAVKRQSGSPANVEQLIEVNEALPSHLYIVSQETLIPHEFRTNVLDTCRFLIRRGWFCPKRLKKVFYRLLAIENDRQRFVELFDEMESAHRVYFLLSVFGRWRSHGEHKGLLMSLLAKAIEDDDSFVFGYAMAMLAEVEGDDPTGEIGAQGIASLTADNSWFPLARFLAAFDYALLPPDQRASVKILVDKKTSVFLRCLLLGDMGSLPSTYLDGMYLRGMLQEFCFLMVPEVASLAALATDRSEAFDAMQTFLLSKPSFKALAISLVVNAVRQRRASAGHADISNLQSLYAHVRDPELRDAMLSVLASIHTHALSPTEDFAKAHFQLANYNGCYLFERVGENESYRYLELIPEDRLRMSIKRDFDSIERVLADLASAGVLSPHEFSYDSAKREVTLLSLPQGDMVPIERGSFALDQGGIAEAFLLAADIYRKAVHFRHITGKTPLIALQNLLMDRRSGNASFFTVGRSLTTPYVFSGVTIGEENADIARMIALLLRQFFFKTDPDAVKFLERKRHSAASGFLAHTIQNMSSKEPSHRYSLERFRYLTNAYNRCLGGTPEQLNVFYLLERLKAGIFRHNPEHMTWQGVCSALNNHVLDLRILFPKEALAQVPLQNRALGYMLTRGRLHWLSFQMLNLTMHRPRIREFHSVDPDYLNLVECLLLYGIVCVETVSLCRATWEGRLLDAEKYYLLLNNDSVLVSASGYNERVPRSDFEALFTYRPDGTGKDIKDLSLRQISLLALLAWGAEIGHDNVHVTKPRGLPSERFDDLAHACLFRIPRVEAEAQKCFEGVSAALRSGDDIHPEVDIDGFRANIKVIAGDFSRLRPRLKLKRQWGRSDGKKLPEKILCKRRFGKPKSAKVDAIPAMTLVNNFPSSRYHCSWDISQNSITNLIVASAGTYAFIMDLKRGKLLGRKLSYLYSGRTMLPWDVALLAVNQGLMILVQSCHDGSQSSFWKTVCTTMSGLLTGIGVGLLLMVFYDLIHWIGPLRDAISHVKRVSENGRR